jgi:hypothetical protein
MLNYKRRKRQADENSNIIIERFVDDIKNGKTLYPGSYHISNDNDLLNLVKKIINKFQTKANLIERNWSIPIILEAIGRMYYGNQKNNEIFGTAFKRSLVYLWSNDINEPNKKKNLDSLLEILRLCLVLENLYAFRRFFLISSEFSFRIKEGYCFCDDKYEPMITEFATLIQGRGKRMRIAAVNSK